MGEHCDTDDLDRATLEQPQATLPCGHPVQCDPAHNDPNPGATHFCGWCVDRDSLTEERDRLAGMVAMWASVGRAFVAVDTPEDGAAVDHMVERALSDTAATAEAHEARIRADERGRVLREAAAKVDAWADRGAEPAEGVRWWADWLRSMAEERGGDDG